ncbi:hypothetical protein ATERTT37_001398 [Aspergillus terreus]
MPLSHPLYISAAAGIASHIAYFNKGEHHLYVTQYLKLFLAAIAAITATLHYTQSQPWPHALSTTSHLAAAYLSGLYTSLLIYRLFLHPLHQFPGPLGSRLSSLYLPTQLNHNLYKHLHAYHTHYGPFVRTGSSDLSIAHPAAVHALYSAASPCTKAAYYDFTHPGLALQNIRDPAAHAARRRVWARAFSDPLLRGYEARVREYQQRLVERLAGMEGRAVDARKWVNLYSFDVMGALTFGEGFGCLERGEPHWAIELLDATMRQIVRHPEEADKLRAELAPYADASDNGELLHSQIANLDHLNGVINEALRLYPPVPGGLQRKTPPEGIMIDDVFIPGDMTVSCPQYVVSRSPLCYEQPDEFIPERWYKRPELIRDKTVFAPFTIERHGSAKKTGPYSCIGKPLAMLNLRTTVARLVMEFDVRFAPGDDGRKFLDEAQDNFVLYMGELNVVFERRR